MKVLLACLLAAPIAVVGQQAAWDDSPHASELAANVARLKPLVDQLAPQEWVAKGAPQTYVTQLQQAQQDLAALAGSAAQLDRQPQKLTAALDTYFRLQTIEREFENIIEAVRKYQNPAVADLMMSVLRSNSANRDGLREFITDLAARKEQEFTIYEQDAQRCRAELNQIPTTSRRNTKK